MSKKVRSLRASDKTWERLEKKAERLGFSSIGKMFEAESQLEDIETRIAIRRESILRYCDHRATNEYAKAIAKNRGLTLQEAHKFLHENMTPAIMHSLVQSSIKLGIQELERYGIPDLTEDENVFVCGECGAGPFASETKLKSHYKEFHPEIFKALYKSGRRVLT